MFLEVLVSGVCFRTFSTSLKLHLVCSPRSCIFVMLTCCVNDDLQPADLEKTQRTFQRISALAQNPPCFGWHSVRRCVDDPEDLQNSHLGSLKIQLHLASVLPFRWIEGVAKAIENVFRKGPVWLEGTLRCKLAPADLKASPDLDGSTVRKLMIAGSTEP